LPVVRRSMAESGGLCTGPDPLASSFMLNSPDSCGSCFEELVHGIDQQVFLEWFQKEGIGPRFSRPARRRQDAEDQHGDVARPGVCLELAAECESIECGDEDLRDDDVREVLPSLLEGAIAVRRESDRVASLIQEVRLELPDVRVAIDDHDDRLAIS
jgi:hypothetical protein